MKLNSQISSAGQKKIRQFGGRKSFWIFLSTLFIFAFMFSFSSKTENVSAQNEFKSDSEKPVNAEAILHRFKYFRNASENAGDPCNPVPIAFGQTISGSLATGDCTDPDTGQVADVYVFTGTQGQAISSALSSAQFDTVLLLVDLSGNVIAFNDDIDQTTTNSRIPPTGTFTLPFSGQFLLFATSIDATGRGNYTINLSGSGSTCDFTLSPTGQFFSSNGGSGMFTVTTTQPTCAWQAVSNAPWITTSSSGTGNGTVSFNVAANTSTQGRAGLILIGNKFFAVTQNGFSCTYSASPTALQIPAIGGQFSINVTASNSACPTNISTADSWLTITNPNGSGSRVVNFSVATNHVPQTRTGVITVLGGPQIDITQIWRATPFSFDNGWQANIGVFRPSTGFWYYKYNNMLTGEPSDQFNSKSFGIAGDKIAPADYDGDNFTDIAVFRDGVWFIIESRNNNLRSTQFGTAGDKPVPGDFDGDRKADISVYRPSSGSWFRLNSGSNQFVAVQFGTAEDVPLMTDFNADGRSEISLYRPSAGAWYWLDSQSGAFNAVNFGLATDIPVPADYDGDSKTDIAVFRPSGGNWFRLNSTNGQLSAINFGAAGDIPVPAEYDADGKADIAVFRPSNGFWYRLKSRTNTIDGWQFGTIGDKPIPAAYQP